MRPTRLHSHQRPFVPTRTDTPSPPLYRLRLRETADPRFRLALALVVAALLVLAYRVYATLVLARPPERLRLGEDVQLASPPDPPGSDLNAVRDRLPPLQPQSWRLNGVRQDAAALLDLAGKAMRAGDLLAAREILRSAAGSSGNPEPRVEETLARCELGLGLYEDAATRLERLLSKAPADVRAAAGLSRAQAALGKNVEAVRTLERAARAASGAAPADRLRLVEELERLGDLPAALREARAVLQSSPEDAEAGLTVARLLYLLHRLEEARPLLERLVARFPENGGAAYYLAVLVNNPLLKQREPAVAEHLLLQNVIRDPGDTRSLRTLGELYQEQGRHRQAAYIFIQLLQAAPYFAPARLQLARAYQRLGRTGEAAAQEATAYRLLARDRAEERLKTRVSQHPKDPDPRLALARHYEAAGQFSRALSSYQAAYVLASDRAKFRDALSEFYGKLGLPSPLAPEQRP